MQMSDRRSTPKPMDCGLTGRRRCRRAVAATHRRFASRRLGPAVAVGRTPPRISHRRRYHDHGLVRTHADQRGGQAGGRRRWHQRYRAGDRARLRVRGRRRRGHEQTRGRRRGDGRGDRGARRRHPPGHLRRDRAGHAGGTQGGDRRRLRGNRRCRCVAGEQSLAGASAVSRRPTGTASPT